MGSRCHRAIATAILVLLCVGTARAQDAQARVAELEAQAKSHELAGRLAEAEASLRSALETGEAAWGESLEVARTLNQLGIVLRQRNQADESARVLGRALEILQRLAPDSPEVAESLH